MTQLPRPKLEDAVAALREREEYQAILQFIRDEREKFLGDFRHCAASADVMKVAGSIAALDELLVALS